MKSFSEKMIDVKGSCDYGWAAERIALRRWREEDADALFALASDPIVGEMAKFPPHGDRAESLRVIREIFSQPETYAVVSGTDGTLLGCINVFSGVKGESVYAAETGKIGYWLGKPFWGNGYMAEAVKMLCGRCFNSGDFKCCRVIGYTNVDNIGSRRVMEKAGFRISAITGNVCYYCLPARQAAALPEKPLSH